MEGGQKTGIDLESGLDINSSDMLVNINQPTFQHNWQHFQGKCLPNSLRFEKNGWAAGWDVFEFKYDEKRVSLEDGNYAGATLLNNNPSYTLNVYSDKTSAKSLATFVFTPKSKLLSGDAKLNGNHITGKVNDKTFDLVWDPLTETITTNSSDIKVEYSKNTSFSYNITVIDEASIYDVNNDIMLPSALSGTGLSGEVPYTSALGITHKWSNFTYFKGDTDIDFNDKASVENFTVTDNVIKFDGEADKDFDFKINLQIDEYVLQFINCVVGNADSRTDPLKVADTASDRLRFNYYYGSMSPTTLKGGADTYSTLTIQLPMWFSIVVSTESEDEPVVALPDNTALANGTFKLDKYTLIPEHLKVTADNLFNKSTAVLRYDTTRKWFSLDACVNRINTIRVSDTMMPTAGIGAFDPKPNVLNPRVIIKEAYAFPLFQRNVAYVTNFYKLFGQCYTILTSTWDASEVFGLNEWWDWTDPKNAVYTERDISNTRSLYALSVPADKKFDTTPDLNYIKNYLPSNSELLSKICMLNKTPDLYDSDDAPLAKPYSSGVYTGGTYEKTVVQFTNDENFWPFEYVPAFNYEYDGIVLKCHAVIDGEPITDLSVFKQIILGAYTAYIGNDTLPYLANTKQEYRRTIYKYNTFFDFKWKELITSTQQVYFASCWSAWYDGYTNPLTLESEQAIADGDPTYAGIIDGPGVIVNTGVVPTWNTLSGPGVVISNHTNYTDAVNICYDWQKYSDSTYQGFILYSNMLSLNKPKFKVTVYENHADATSKYDIDNLSGYISPGEIRVGSSTLQQFNVFDTMSWGGSTANTTAVNTSTSNISAAGLDFYCEAKDSSAWYSMIAYSDAGPEGHDWVYRQYPSGHTQAGQWYWVKDKTYYMKSRIGGLFSGTKSYVSRSSGKGLIYTACHTGFIQYQVKYNDVLTSNEITLDTDKAFTFEPIDASLRLSDVLYVDGKYNTMSYDWFSIILSDVAVVEDPTLNLGNMNCTITAKNTAKLYYADPKKDSNNNEIFYNAYFPDIAGENGGLSSTSNTRFKIYWNPDMIYVPVEASVVVPDINSNVSIPHVFFTKGLELIKNAECEFMDKSTIDADERKTQYYITMGDSKVTIDFDCKTKTSTFASDTFNLSNAYSDIVIKDISAGYEGSNISAPATAKMYLKNVTGRFATSSPDTLLSYSENKFTCKLPSGNIYIYNILKQCIEGSSAVVSVTDFGTYQNIQFEDAVKSNIAAILSNVVANAFTFEYAGKTLTVDVSEFLESDNFVDVYATDIRTPAKTDHIGRINASKEYQLIKQQWNSTVEVENFWWVDDDHILELNDLEFVLKRKTDDLDDWNGDRWEDLYHINRSNILTSDARKYFVANTYESDQHALLCVLYVDSDYRIRCDVHDPLNSLSLIGTCYMEVTHRDIGETLNQTTVAGAYAIFNTYSVLNATQLLTQATWSNTITDGKLFIGCHINNNFNQWAIVVDLDTFNIDKCIQGYGYVGIDGSLTGGQIPDKYMNEEIGFNSKVEELSVLASYGDTDNADALYEQSSLNNLNVVAEHIVGTAERQWYIGKVVSGIVSHLIWSKGDGEGKYGYIKQLLPITNKFDACYKSPSFYNCVIGDPLVCLFPFANLLKLPAAAQSAWNIIMGLVGYPMLFMFNPRYANFVYLQQTLGQYAYVHYNSSESMERPDAKSTADKNGMEPAGSQTVDPNMSSDYVFDKQIYSQEAHIAAGTTLFVQALFLAFAPAFEHIESKNMTNSETNQTATSDKGNKYSSMAMENLAHIAVSSLRTESNDIGLNSHVTGIKSLDMFYSTSDKQRVYAGPGFVEHQFVADCVAQSSTDTQIEGTVQQISFTIKALTMITGRMTIATQLATADYLDKMADSMQGSAVCGTTFGPAIAAGFAASAKVMRTLAKTTEAGYDQLESILDIFASTGVTSNRTGMVSRHATTIEAHHKYGEKNETFMWPCWGVPTSGNNYTDEQVTAVIKESSWELNLIVTKFWNAQISVLNIPYCGIHNNNFVKFSSMQPMAHSNTATWNLEGSVPFYTASCLSEKHGKILPEDMACIQGVESLLPDQAFKNENIGYGEPAFTPSMFQDYIIDKRWELSQTCTYGLQQWVTVKDTKITSCAPSNMRISSSFCGIATPYEAVEVKRGLSKAYMRPWAITPNVLAFNCTGYNSILDRHLYHSFDGISYRLVNWVGTPGLGKGRQTFLYAFQVNDRFKRSNKFPANEVQGAFNAQPVQAVSTLDPLWTQVTCAANEKGMEGGTIGEDKDTTRWAVPIFTEPVTLLPAAVKTLTAMPLIVYDGITSLCTDIANNQAAYKAPLSVDFTIGKNVYRQTEDYICSITTTEGLDIVTELVPSLGLKYIGATPTEAYFYSKATRYYYTFTGSTLTKMDMMERFRDIKSGHWDFVNQEVVMPCLMTFKRLNAEVEDKDTETDNIIVPVLSKGHVSGELIPPITTIFNDRSWYKVASLPSGLAYQGPNRVIINRSVFVEYMTESMKGNFGKWKKMNREKYTTKREYPEVYEKVDTDISGVEGWTHNPFLLVTSALGSDANTDCLFEWVITFCWPIEMDLLYGPDNYAVVNITAETMTPGGKVKSRPTHVYLTKELFTRTGNYGYYSFRYQSKNGIGNRERLHIWSDQYIAISNLQCEYKSITSRRTEVLTQQLDVQKLKEL